MVELVKNHRISTRKKYELKDWFYRLRKWWNVDFRFYFLCSIKLLNTFYTSELSKYVPQKMSYSKTFNNLLVFKYRKYPNVCRRMNAIFVHATKHRNTTLAELNIFFLFTFNQISMPFQSVKMTKKSKCFLHIFCVLLILWVYANQAMSNTHCFCCSFQFSSQVLIYTRFMVLCVRVYVWVKFFIWKKTQHLWLYFTHFNESIISRCDGMYDEKRTISHRWKELINN